MTETQFQIDPNVKDWLLEDDPENPSIRFFTLINLLDEDPASKTVLDAKKAIMESGPVPEILSHQQEVGYWVEPGAGYRPKYTSTVWSLIFLAQLGADPNDGRVARAAEYVLENAYSEKGFFSINGNQSGTVHCLAGNLAAALIDLGREDDDRLNRAIDWMARSVTGDGFGEVGEKDVDPHYIRSGISGPGFVCSSNDHQPCAWGAVKVGLALGKIPEDRLTPQIEKAIDVCRKFLLSVDPATADYPHPYGKKPSGSWFKFGFPVFYVTDALQNLEALLTLGLAGDKRLRNLAALVEDKRQDDGRWLMEYSYNGKTWVEIEEKKAPSKWVTLRALTALKRFYA